MSCIKLQNVVKIYLGGVRAVDNFSLQIADCTFLVLVGPSGCGKSTLLRMIAGLETITDGQIWLDDACVNNLHPKDRDIAMVFQNYALYPHLNVYQNMALGLEMRKVPKKLIKERVNTACQALKIDDLLTRKPSALSGGQQQRVALGRAIVRNPKVFLMDEPLSNLDAKLRVEMRAEIVKLHRQLKTTFIYVTHDQTEAMTMGEKIVVMKDGLIQQVASPDTLYRYPANKFVAEFIGLPSCNFLNVAICDGQIKLDDGQIISANAPQQIAQHQRVWLGIRPEHITSVSQKVPAITGVVDYIEHMGADKLVFVRLGDALVKYKLPSHHIVTSGDRVHLRIDFNAVHYFDLESECRIRTSILQS